MGDDIVAELGPGAIESVSVYPSTDAFDITSWDDDVTRYLEGPTITKFSIDGYSDKVVYSTYKGDDIMRRIYRVLIVDPEGEVILRNEVLIAKSSDSARLKAAQGMELTGDFDDYDFVVFDYGAIRDKREVQEVRVIE
jgi:hypothetical protein